MRVLASVLIFFGFFCALSASAAVPGFEAAQFIQDGGSVLDVGYGSAPTVVDWDNDGRKDLVIGTQYNGGKVRLYLNTGTDEAPLFDGYVHLQSGGVDITDPAGG